MPILEHSSVDDRKRLLELFPLADLRETWPHKGTKEELCYAAASDASPDQLAKVVKFADDHICCCKQHIYVFAHDGSATLPESIVDGEKVFEDESHALYLARVSYVVVLRNPLEETTLEFLWPVRIERTDHYLIVRCVVLEKNTSSYFDRPAYVARKSLNEKSVLAGIPPEAAAADINKGIKKLWADGYIESTRSDYKKPYSTATEKMDEERGIKEHYPEVYAIMQEAPLYLTVFEVTDNENSVESFSTDPSHGLIGFTSYSDLGDTDVIIDKILTSN
jgi:hypothetical protein